jgi:hypothetical protein
MGKGAKARPKVGVRQGDLVPIVKDFCDFSSYGAQPLAGGRPFDPIQLHLSAYPLRISSFEQ